MPTTPASAPLRTAQKRFNLACRSGWRNTTNKFHAGIDISAQDGTYVYNPTNSTCVTSGYDPTYGCGYYLVLETANNVYGSSTKIRVLFQHLYEYPTTTNPYMIKQTSIPQSTIVARTGDTGSPGSFHLHYTIITDGSSVFQGGGYDQRTFDNTEQPLVFHPNKSFASYN
ncbi:MAG: M23 family metallopeptidase [Clostridiales bacterium]|nr:M23 family metallopeptidase [Clostridiales bacterium]